MADKGAKHLILLSRSKKEDQETQNFLQLLRQMGVDVAALTCDITNERAVQDVIETCTNTMPPIKGCVQATMVSKVSVHFLAVGPPTSSSH